MNQKLKILECDDSLEKEKNMRLIYRSFSNGPLSSYNHLVKQKKLK
jgi:hypothetical protein